MHPHPDPRHDGETIGRCPCGGTLAVDDSAEKPITVWVNHHPERWTVLVRVLACNACEFVQEVL